MQLKIRTPNSIKNISELVVGDLVLCEDGVYLPVKSIFMISCKPKFIRTSNNLFFYIPERIKIKTSTGFKSPELWDVLDINDAITPMITTLKIIDRVMFFYDILVEGNIVSPEGLIFKYAD